MSTLIITLPLAPPGAGDAPAELAFCVSADGTSVSQHGQAPLALLPRPPRGYAQVVAVVPAQALSWQRVVLPRGSISSNPQRLQAVLGGLLEEQLLDETDQLHLALAPDARGEQPSWVAACDKTWLAQQVQALEAAQWPVARIVPELWPQGSADASDTAAGQTASLQVLGQASGPWLACADHRGVTLAALDAAALALHGVAADVPVLAEPALAAQAEQLLGRKVLVQQASTRQLLAAQSPWNLAQFDLHRSSGSRTAAQLAQAARLLARSPAWRPARWALAALLLVQLAGLNAFAWRESAALRALRAAQRDILTGSFPQVSVVIDAPLQMARELARQQQASGLAADQDLELILQRLSPLAQQGRGLTAIEFEAGTARVQGLAATPDQLAPLRAAGLRASTEGPWLVLRAAAPGAPP